MRDWVKFGRSFRYAYEGIKYALASQQNMQAHFVASFFILLLALLCGLSKLEILFLLLAVTLVIVTELINTAVEKAVDLAMPDRHPLAKIAKDVAAASVLVSALFAVVTGVIVFYDPLDRLFRYSREPLPYLTGIVGVTLALVGLVVTVAQTRFRHRGAKSQPSLIAAVAAAVSVWIALLADHTAVVLLSFALSALVMVATYEKKGRPWSSLAAGGLIGAGVTLLAHVLIVYL